MRKSCGALLYAFNTNGQVGVILGLEDNHWFVFKGGPEQGEDVKTAAIREVYEETNKLVKLESIDITYVRKTNHKEYHIGLCMVPYSIIEEFNSADKTYLDSKYIEKKELRFFTIDEALMCRYVHAITKDTIIRYKDNLMLLNKHPLVDSCKMRRQSVSTEYAAERYKKLTKNITICAVDADEVISDTEPCEIVRCKQNRKKKNNPFRLFNCTTEESAKKATRMKQQWRCV